MCLASTKRSRAKTPGAACWSAPLSRSAWGLLVGLINAFLINILKIVPFIATLSTMGAALGLSVVISQGAPIGSANDFALISSFSPQWNPLSPALVVVIIVITVLGLYLHKARVGLYTYAIGSNAFAARAAGINVARHLTWVYALSGALAGLAGIYVYIRRWALDRPRRERVVNSTRSRR